MLQSCHWNRICILAKRYIKSASPKDRTTGARTTSDKDRSRHNARKHAIFAKVLFLKGESRSEFNALWDGLRSDFGPVGTIEEALVEKLAVLVWRYRRLLAAETGEVRKHAEFLEWDGDREATEEASQILVDRPEDYFKRVDMNDSGLIRYCNNPKILDLCVELLREMEAGIKERGFERTAYDQIISRLYGVSLTLRQTVKDEYKWCGQVAGLSADDRRRHGCPSLEECVSGLLKAIDDEISWLVNYKRERAQVDSRKIRLDRLRYSIPDSTSLDRLLRYETTLERALDRTLNQLERLQRIRLGQTVLPAIKLDISSSRD
jgi:hypothetical protein